MRITFANGSDPDQDRYFVGPDLDTNWFDTLIDPKGLTFPFHPNPCNFNIVNICLIMSTVLANKIYVQTKMVRHSDSVYSVKPLDPDQDRQTRIQIVCDSDSLPENFFKKLILKIVDDNKNMISCTTCYGFMHSDKRGQFRVRRHIVPPPPPPHTHTHWDVCLSQNHVHALVYCSRYLQININQD